MRLAPAALAPTALPAAAGPIELHCDLEVEPSREKEMLENYLKIFRPTISRQPGFVSVKLLKLRVERRGKAPAGCPYRLIISFAAEEQRLTWVATDDHQKAWPTVERTLKGALYSALLYDPAS